MSITTVTLDPGSTVVSTEEQSITLTSIAVNTGPQGPAGANGTDGQQGNQGDQGIQGDPGSVGPKGNPGVQGIQGNQGIQGVQGDPGFGIPSGGSTAELLIKASNADYDFAWSPQVPSLAWGAMTGTLADQTDLQTELDTLQTNIDGKSDDPHSHTEINILDLDKYTEAEVDAFLATKAATGANGDITSLSGLTTALSIPQGGTGGNSVSTAQQALDVEVGVDVQAFNTHLEAIRTANKADGNFLVTNGTTYVAESGATARTSMGLGSAAVQDVGVTQDDVVQLDAVGLPAVDGSQLTGIVTAPPGALFPYAGSTAPTGYLLAYGQAVSRTTYAALFAAIGITFGDGDESTTFNLPDLRGRVPLALDNLGGNSANRVTAAAADTLGGIAGAETHTLLDAEMPSHAHSYTRYGNASDNGSSSGTTDFWINTTSVSTGSAGSDAAHNNMQPYLALAYIIKT